MLQPAPHPMMAAPDHDEQARQHFTVNARIHMLAHAHPGVRQTWERQVKPAFEKRRGRAPGNRHEVRKAMEEAPYYQMYASIMRSLREQFWDSFIDTADRQRPDLIARSKAAPQGDGTLTLDPTLAIPRYYGAIDVHVRPGGNHTEYAPDDVSAGAVTDRGGFYYVFSELGARALGMTSQSKRIVEGRGLKLVDFLDHFFPGTKVRRILDIGCGNGINTVSLADAFPDAEIHGIDVSAPELRYGHARNRYLGKVMHLSQQNAEATNFPDGHFDLVVSGAVFHETSATASHNIMKECHRLLRPGGVTAHYERAFYQGRDLFEHFVDDWDTYYDNEPFKGTFREMNPLQLFTSAGFAEENVALAGVSQIGGGAGFTSLEKGSRAMIGARK